MKANAPEKLYVDVHDNLSDSVLYGFIEKRTDNDIEYTRTDALEVKEVEEEPVSKDLEEAADKHLVEKGYLLTTKNGEHLAEIEAKGLFKAGAQWQKEQLINKACEWLSNVSIEDMHYQYNDFDTSEGWYKFIEEFKKAMEE